MGAIQNSSWDQQDGIPQFKTPDGISKIRILSEDIGKLYSHWIKLEGSTKKKRADCLTRDKGCPFCKYNFKAEIKGLAFIFDYSDEKLKRFEIPVTLAQKINAIKYDSETKCLRDFDIKILKSGSGFKTDYSAYPLPPSPLTETQQQIIEKTVDKTPWSQIYPDQAMEQLYKYLLEIDPDWLESEKMEAIRQNRKSGVPFIPSDSERQEIIKTYLPDYSDGFDLEGQLEAS